MPRLTSNGFHWRLGRALWVGVGLLALLGVIATWLVSRRQPQARPDPVSTGAPRNADKGKVSKRDPSRTDTEGATSRVLALVSKLKAALEARAYAEDLIPVLLQLEDVVAREGREGPSIALLTSVLRSRQSPVPLRALAAIVLTAGSEGIPSSALLECLRESARLDAALVFAFAITPGRASDSAERRRAFWRGVFMSSDFEPTLLSRYEEDYFVRKYGKRLKDGGSPAAFDEYWEILAGMTEFVKMRSVGAEDTLVRGAIVAYIKDGPSMEAKSWCLDILKKGADLDEAVVQGFKDPSASEKFQRGAINVLSGENDEAYLNTIASLFPHAKSDGVYAHALHALSGHTWQSEHAVERLCQIIKTVLESRGDTALSASAVRGLALIQRESSENFLRDLSLADPRSWVRSAALAACSEIGQGNPLVPRRMDTIEAAVLGETDPTVKRVAVQRLGALIAIGAAPKRPGDLRRELESFKATSAAQSDPDLLRLIAQLCEKYLQ